MVFPVGDSFPSLGVPHPGVAPGLLPPGKQDQRLKESIPNVGLKESIPNVGLTIVAPPETPDLVNCDKKQMLTPPSPNAKLTAEGQQ